MLLDVTTSDAELVDRARGGDSAAFSELFDRHAVRVANVCRQRLRSASDVDDAVQESFARALANLHQLRNSAQFGAWVRSIAVRACMDHHRAARRVVALDTDDHPELEDAAPRPEEVVEAAERQATVHGYLQELGARDRHALWLRHVREAPVSAVASELGLTEGSTRVMLARARQRLRAAASGLGILVPVSWRQWFRDHMPANIPAFDAIAMAMAFTIAGGVAGAAQVKEQRVRDPRPAAAVERQDDGAQRRERKAPEATRRRERPAPAASPARPAARPTPDSVGQAPSPPAEGHRPGPVARVRDSVDVTRSYPDEDETDELADVTVFTGEEESTLRLYAGELGPAKDTVTEGADQVLTAPRD